MEELIKKLMTIFEESYINGDMELILIPKTNTYFRISGCKDELDIKCKLLEWCSRTIFKGIPFKRQKANKLYRIQNLNRLNKVLGTSFSNEDIELIYCTLGNCINHELTIRFINSNYDLSILRKAA